MEKQSIVVGICGCTQLYHGELKGKKLQIGDASLLLTEQEIPEKEQREALQKIRPHFFLDAHSWNTQDGGGRYSVTVFPLYVVHSEGGSYDRSVYMYGSGRWIVEVPPLSQVVIDAIQDIAKTMNRRMTLEQWKAWLLQH